MEALPESEGMSNARKQALHWVATIKTDAASDADLAAFQDWLKTPAHKALYDEAERTWDGLRKTPTLQTMFASEERPKGRSFVELAGQALFSYRWTTAGAAVAAALIIAAFPIAVSTPSTNAYETRTAEIRTIDLPDGSQVDLAPESRIRVQYGMTYRRIELTAGEAFFDVTPNLMRDFVVIAGDAKVTVVGTRFNVNRSPTEAVIVSVQEGEVRVSRDVLRSQQEDSADTATLTAGEQVVTQQGSGLADIIEVGPKQTGAWRTGYLHYDDSALGDVLGDVNRYSEKPITVESPDLNALRVYATFTTSQVDDMLAGIEGLLPIVIDRSDNERVVIRRAAQNGRPD